MTARNWCYTWNDESLQFLVVVPDMECPYVMPDDDKIRYNHCQLEKAPTTGRFHLQGFICFKTPVRLVAVIALLPHGAHIERMRGTVKENMAYCSKSETKLAGPWSKGVAPVNQGNRTDWQDVIDTIATGAPVKEIYAMCPHLLNCSRGVKEAYKYFAPPPVCPITAEQLYPWQQMVVEICLDAVAPRIWHWVWSKDFGKGKSTLGTYLAMNHGALVCSMDRKAILYAYEGQKILVFDIPRAVSLDDSFFNLLEELSDCKYLMADKYESCSKLVRAHIIVLSNHAPPTVRYGDRINEIKIIE